ncbi:MAG: TetR family transcriptional regulator [Psychrobium sp.]
MSKRDLILSTAKTIFIEKGFRGTTIANIAESAGIAKGSVYSYFTSKLDIVKALILQSDEKGCRLVEQLLENSALQERELLQAYLAQEFQEVLNERSFIQVFMTDDVLVMEQELMSVVQECRLNYHLSQQRVLTQAYGEKIKPWLFDIVSLVNGLLQEYSVYLTLDEADFSIERCASLVAFCIDSSIASLVVSDLEPLLTRENFPLTRDLDSEQAQREKAASALVAMRETCETMDAVERRAILDTLQLIESELDKEQVSQTMVRALIANLRPYQSLQRMRRQLADATGVELI